MDINFWFTAGISGLLGACIAGLWGIFKDILSRKAEAKSLSNGLIAEIRTLDHTMRTRRYRTEIENLISEMKKQKVDCYQFGAYIGDGFGPVYKASVQKIGMIDKGLAAEIITFHSILYAISCDFHEKSFFQKQGYDIETLESMVGLFLEAEQTASRILARD
ncbi:hypothetical protein AZ013_004128 [Citrobacter freundii]|nr:hypothetical protein AZ013_004128 [Citrobacter freundii]